MSSVINLTSGLSIWTDKLFDESGSVPVFYFFDMSSLVHRHPHHHHVANVSAGLCE